MSGTFIHVESFIPSLPTHTYGADNVVRLDFSVIGIRQYLVSLCEVGGPWDVVWDGTDYSRALQTAIEMASEYGCQIVNRAADA